MASTFHLPLTQLMVPDTGQPKLFFNGRPQSPVGLQNCAYFRRPFEWLYHSSEVKKMSAKERDSRHAARSRDEVPDQDSTSRSVADPPFAGEEQMILITGASGSVGKVVLAEVARSGQKHRAMYRSKEEAAKAPAGTETVIVDFADKTSLVAAMRGVESVYLVCSPIPDLVRLESNAIEACEAAGVRRVVLNSALGAGDYPKSFPSWHRKVEDKLKSTKMAYCILRPNSFMQNVLTYYAPSIRAEGAFYGAMGNARTSYLDVRDIAVVASKALQGGQHDAQTYELNGPEALTYAEVAEKISRHAGISAKYVDIPAEAQRKAMLDQGMPEWQVTALLDLQEYYTGGKGRTLDGLLERLLGRPPARMDAFLQEYTGEFRAQSAKA
jgi:uncharacterized protein YbjT (DUF2867 family)